MFPLPNYHPDNQPDYHNWTNDDNNNGPCREWWAIIWTIIIMLLIWIEYMNRSLLIHKRKVLIAAAQWFCYIDDFEVHNKVLNNWTIEHVVTNQSCCIIRRLSQGNKFIVIGTESVQEVVFVIIWCWVNFYIIKNVQTINLFPFSSTEYKFLFISMHRNLFSLFSPFAKLRVESIDTYRNLSKV